MFDLEQIILERHSTRLFLPQPVPRALVEEALVLAQHAPSNSNIQPWHMVFASGPARDRLRRAEGLKVAHFGNRPAFLVLASDPHRPVHLSTEFATEVQERLR